MKRRTIIIRLAILLAAAALGWGGWQWWTAPRIDRRLVGEWDVASYSGDPNFVEWPFQGRFVLKSSGDIDSQTIRDASSPIPMLGSYPWIPFGYRAGYRQTCALWTVRDGRLVVKCRYQQVFERWSVKFYDLWCRLSSSKYRWESAPLQIEDRAEFQIVEVGDGRMVLSPIGEETSPGDQIILQRGQTEFQMP